MTNEKKGERRKTDEAGERIEQRRSAEKEQDRREEEGLSQPESSAQKHPPEGPQP